MRRLKSCAVLAVAGIVVLLGLFWFELGPWYQGRPLNFWLKGFDSPYASVRLQSANAVQQMGKRALPALISHLKHKIPDRSSWWRRNLGRIWRIPPPGAERFETLAALDALGPAGKDAIPDLEKLADQTPPVPIALLVIARMGQDSVPVLTAHLASWDKVNRIYARRCLELMQSNSVIVSPKTQLDFDFKSRLYQFTSILRDDSFREYRADHPERFAGDQFLQSHLLIDLGTSDLYSNRPAYSPNTFSRFQMAR